MPGARVVVPRVAAADAHPDAVHHNLWVDAVDVRALDLPQARGPVHGPVVLTVVCVFINPVYKHLRRLASGSHRVPRGVVSLDGGAWRPGWLLLPRASFNCCFYSERWRVVGDVPDVGGTPDWEGGVGRSRPRAHAARVSWSAGPFTTRGRTRIRKGAPSWACRSTRR